ncbi:MAG: acyltransferase [Bacteroidetes bacterium]|nr:acyltransferase [Bacteroidota bacterium]
MGRVYGLDSLRAIAALTVLVGHIELVKSNLGLPNLSSIPFFDQAGHNGVLLFFVISGYIITRLLLGEQEKTGNISIKRFYMRRILRIWPLYFFILLITMLVYGYRPGWTTGILCFTILANVAHALGQGWLVSPQIWSIGAEEQFYLFWPSLVKYLRSNLGLVLAIIIIGYTALPHILRFFLDLGGWASPGNQKFIDVFFYGTKFNLLAMGGLLAWCQKKGYGFLGWFHKGRLSVIFVILPFLLWFSGWHPLYFADVILGLLFTLMLANVTVTHYLAFNNRILDYLGKVSYGIYMFHWVVIMFLATTLSAFMKTNYQAWNIVLYLLSFSLTIMVSVLSYHTMERYFLNLKKKFETAREL